MAETNLGPLMPDLGDPYSGGGSYELPATFSEGLGAAIELGYEESPVMSWARKSSVEGLEALGQKKIAPDQLNEMYPGMEVPFDAPESQVVAQYKYDRTQERRKLQELTKGAGTVGAFVGNVIGSLADPVNFALNYAIGLGAQGAIAKAGGAKGFTQIKNAVLAKSASESVPAALAREGVEGLVGSVATEPLSYIANKKESLDYKISDSINNVLVGSFAFPLGMAGVKGLARLPRALKNMANTNPKAIESGINTARVQLENDKVVNVDSIVKQHEGEVGNTISEKIDLDTSKPLQGEFYAVSTKASDNLEDTTNFADLGDHYYVTDSKNVSNSYASREFMEVEGTILPVDLKDAKIIDIDLPFDENTKKAFGDIKVEGFESPRQALDAIDDPAVKAQVAEGFKALGYDGYKFDGGKEFDNGKSHNAIALFEKDKITQKDQILRGDKNKKPQAVPESEVEIMKENLTTEKGDVDYNPELKKQFEMLTTDKPDAFTSKFEEVKLENDEMDLMLKEEISFNEKLETPDQGLLKIKEEIDLINKRAKEEESAFKAALNCLMGE